MTKVNGPQLSVKRKGHLANLNIPAGTRSEAFHRAEPGTESELLSQVISPCLRSPARRGRDPVKPGGMKFRRKSHSPSAASSLNFAHAEGTPRSRNKKHTSVDNAGRI